MRYSLQYNHMELCIRPSSLRRAELVGPVKETLEDFLRELDTDAIGDCSFIIDMIHKVDLATDDTQLTHGLECLAHVGRSTTVGPDQILSS